MGKKNNSSLPPIGLVYRETAWSVMIESGFPTFEIDELLSHGKMREVEQFVKIAPMLEVACHKLSRYLTRRVVVPSNFFWTIMFSETPKTALSELILELRLGVYDEQQKAIIIVAMLNALHDEWVRLNRKEFFNPDKKKLQCKYMPFPLIGMGLALDYRIYINELLSVIGWSTVDVSAIRSAYLNLQDKFTAKHSLFSEVELVDFIASANYDALSADIKKKLEGNKQLASWMVFS